MGKECPPADGSWGWVMGTWGLIIPSHLLKCIQTLHNKKPGCACRLNAAVGCHLATSDL